MKPLARIGRGHAVVLLLVATGLYFGVPRALIAVARSYESKGRDAAQIVRGTRRRLEMLEALASLAGHSKAASRAMSRVASNGSTAVAALAAEAPKRRRELARAMLSLGAMSSRAHYTLKSSLCKLGALDELATLGDFLEGYRGPAVAAAFALGHAGRAEALLVAEIERQLARSSLSVTYDLERLVVAGAYRRADMLAGRLLPKLEPKQRTERARMLALRCAVKSALGLPSSLAGIEPGAERARCAAARLAAMIARGDRATLPRAIDTLRGAQPNRYSRSYTLVELAALAELGRWQTLRRRARQMRLKLGRVRRLYQIFNDIYTKPVPLALIDRLARRISERLLHEDGQTAAELRQLLGKVLVDRASQAVLRGRPARGLADVERAVGLVRRPAKLHVLHVELVGLLRGAKAALALYDSYKLREPVVAARLAAHAGDQARLAALVPQLSADKRCRYNKSLCLMLRAEAALGKIGAKNLASLTAARRAELTALRRKLTGQTTSPMDREPAELRIDWVLDRHKAAPAALDKVFRYVYLSNVGQRAITATLLARLLDPSGELLRVVSARWMCQGSQTSVDGDLYAVYALERDARRRGDSAALKRLAQRRARLGALVRNAAQTLPRGLPR